MAKQLMIYDNVTPLSSQAHKDLCLETGVPYDFAKEIRAVPLVAAEMQHAAREYTIVFAPADNEGGVALLAILGAKENENVYVTPEGEWNASYIPAFIRRYPFVFSPNEDGTQFALCIDESWAGCNREGKGRPLFDEKGERTEFLESLLKFNEGFQRSAQQTTAFCKQLKELDIFEAKEARLTLGNGQESRLTGFMVVSREKLAALSPEKLSEMTKSGALELIYAHLLSMNNLGIMASKLNERHAANIA